VKTDRAWKGLGAFFKDYPTQEKRKGEKKKKRESEPRRKRGRKLPRKSFLVALEPFR
jgi:hypothetical protein